MSSSTPIQSEAVLNATVSMTPMPVAIELEWMQDYNYVGTIIIIACWQLVWLYQYKRGISRKSVSYNHRNIWSHYEYYKIPIAFMSHAAINHYTTTEPTQQQQQPDEEQVSLLSSMSELTNTQTAATTTTTTSITAAPQQDRDSTILKSIFAAFSKGQLSGLSLLTLHCHLLWTIKALELWSGGAIAYWRNMVLVCCVCLGVDYILKVLSIQRLSMPIFVNPFNAVETLTDRRQSLQAVWQLESSSPTPLVTALLILYSHMTSSIAHHNRAFAQNDFLVFLYLVLLFGLSLGYYNNSWWHGGAFNGVLAGSLVSNLFMGLLTSTMSPPSVRYWSNFTCILVILRIITSLKAATSSPDAQRWSQILFPCIEHVAWDHLGRFPDIASYRAATTRHSEEDQEAVDDSQQDSEQQQEAQNSPDEEEGFSRRAEQEDAEEGDFVDAPTTRIPGPVTNSITSRRARTTYGHGLGIRGGPAIASQPPEQAQISSTTSSSRRNPQRLRSD